VDQAAQERPRRDDDGAGAIRDAGRILHADDATLLDDEARGEPLPHLEVRDVLHRVFHRRAVAGAVALRAGRAHGRTARGVQRLELDRRAIRDGAHGAAERVDLANEVSLRGAADGGIARHLPDRVEVQREQQRAAAEPRRRERRLASRVARTHDEDVEGQHDVPV
jgi:hypothetical protein